MKNEDNMAQPSAFRPLMNSKELLMKEITEKIRLNSKNILFNNSKNWPVYPKYLMEDDPRYRK